MRAASQLREGRRSESVHATRRRCLRDCGHGQARTLQPERDRLLLDGGRNIAGAIGPAGELLPAGVVPPGVTGSELRSEPLLADRAALRALESGACITVVDGEAALALADADGVAALLRW